MRLALRPSRTSSKYPRVVLKDGRDKPLRRHHPWVFSGAIKSEDAAEPGAVVDVCSTGGEFLGRGLYNAASQIRVRIFSFEDEALDEAFFAKRINAAIARRDALLGSKGQSAARLIMSEADQLPGLIVDRYGPALVMQALTAGIDARIEMIADLLTKATGANLIVERSDDQVRDLEKLPRRSRALRGEVREGDAVVMEENGLKFSVDLLSGHKTGYYLDQRQNHAFIGGLAKDGRVLDAFSYTGGFALNALSGGAAHVLCLDQSGPALARLARNAELNGLKAPKCIEGDAFKELRSLRDAGERFDVVVLDPPKFAQTAGQVEQAARGYKDINLLGFKLARPGGYLATFSCSGHVSPDLFQKIVFGAASDAGVEAQIVQHLSQADDHPILLSFPESHYLKGLLCRII